MRIFGRTISIGSLSMLVFSGITLAGMPIACSRPAHPSDEAPTPERHATVRVDNQRSLDMDVFILGQATPQRLGTVTGHASAVFAIPVTFIGTNDMVRFLASPIGGATQPVSEPITVNSGEEISVTIESY